MMKPATKSLLLKIGITTIVASTLVLLARIIFGGEGGGGGGGGDAHSDVGDCVARALIKQLNVGADRAADIGAKVKEATDATVGIKSSETLAVVQQTMSDATQAAIVDVCARQYGALPLFNPIVKVVEKDSNEPVAGVTIRNGSDYEKCETSSEGVCRLLIASRRAGQRYIVDATCDHMCSDYAPTSEELDEQILRAGGPILVRLNIDTSVVTFDVIRNGIGVTGVTIEPDFDGSFRNQQCQSVNLHGGDCHRAISQHGIAAFHFSPRPAEIKGILILDNGKQVPFHAAIPDAGTRVVLNLDPPDGGPRSARVCQIDGDAPPAFWDSKNCAAPHIKRGSDVTKLYLDRFPNLGDCTEVIEYKCP